MSIQSVRSFARLAGLAIAAALLPSSLQSQQLGDAERANAAALTSIATTTAPVAAAVPAADANLSAGPRVTQAGISTNAQADEQGFGQPQRGQPRVGLGSNLALMGVGAAAVVIGLMVGGNGGTILALGGAVVGLVGLYRYLQ